METPSNTPQKNILTLFKKILKYSISIILLFVAFDQVGKSFISFILLFALALLVLPLLEEPIRRKVPALNYAKYRYTIYLILFIGGGVTSSKPNQNSANPIVQQQKEKSKSENALDTKDSIRPSDNVIAVREKPISKVSESPNSVSDEEREKQIEKQFSSWDGSHIKLEMYIKENLMNDPDSYKHVKTTYWDMKTYVIVLTTFRGKNPFGGVVLNSIKAKVDLDGNVLEIIQ